MPKLHIANVFFEWELEVEPQVSLREAFQQHPIFRQLQFLPFLYAENNDAVLLSDLPTDRYWEKLQSKGIPRLKHFLLEDKPPLHYTEIESWGPSQLIAKWAKSKSLHYDIPSWAVIKEVNSKRFSFENSPKLPHAVLLESQSQAKQWIHNIPGKKVFKTCYGVSGTGHLILDGASSDWEKAMPFLLREWKKGFPVIAEPWVKRKLDFSTQWHIDRSKTVSYLGATLCCNDERGQYRHNIVGDEKALFRENSDSLQKHKQIAEPLLQSIASRGFFGNLGIDAMLYYYPEPPHQVLLQPIVEINARKTMGWVALQYLRKYFADQPLCFQYATGLEGYLPEFVEAKQGKKILFSRNLTIEANAIYN